MVKGRFQKEMITIGKVQCMKAIVHIEKELVKLKKIHKEVVESETHYKGVLKLRKADMKELMKNEC
jgi:hypothetical protein